MPKSQNYLHRMIIPFPPSISVDSLLERSRNNSSKPGKVPNCFLIYRLVWTEQLKLFGMKLDLSEISNFVGLRWKNESKEVKDFYRKLSSEAKKKFLANSKARFIYHDKCDLNYIEQLQDDASPNSQHSPESVSPGASFSHLPLPMDINQSFPDHDPTMDYFAGLTNGISFEAEPSLHQSCSLKERINEFLRLMFSITPESCRKLHDMEGIITTEELERIKIVLELNKSMMFDQFISKSSSKCTLLNHMSAIKEKMIELEFATSDAEMFEPTPQDSVFINDYTQSVGFHQQSPNPPECYDFAVEKTKELEEKAKQYESRIEYLEERFRHTSTDIRPTYPPQITIQEIIEFLPSTNPRRPFQPINGFKVYRIAIIRQIRTNNNGLTIPGSYISTNYSRESPDVKRTYQRLAIEVNNEFRQIHA
ncbi:2879_t:CDS:2 [Funneliformis geosporum]|nr:2879_t:CDS:2 [Funneliformis geosporum]